MSSDLIETLVPTRFHPTENLDDIAFMERDERPLTKDDIKKGLGSLGVTPGLGHAYLSLNVSRLGLTSLHLVNQYKRLHTLDVSQNELRSLDWISGMTALLNINASHNKLISIPSFLPPKLERIDLSFNQIEYVGEWTFCERLRELNLRGNHLYSIGEGIRSNLSLERLDVSENSLRTLEGLEGLGLTELSASANELTSLLGISGLERLELLDVQQNFLQNLDGLDPFTHRCLRTLNLVENRFSHPDELRPLAAFGRLADLFLAPSKVAEVPAYRTQMLHRVRQLRWLDGSEVLPEEVVKAAVTYGEDVESRREIWERVIGERNDPFVDRRLMTAELITQVEARTGTGPAMLPEGF